MIMDKALHEYRQHLVLAEQKAQEDYDKAVLSLSGGGLGVSLAFVEKVVGAGSLRDSWLLAGSWLCWAVSIACVLYSYFLSRRALRCAIIQVDDGQIQTRRPGGGMAVATEIANFSSGILFVIGAILISIFAVTNLEAKNAQVPQTIHPVATSSATHH
jgi:hypothetical protein